MHNVKWFQVLLFIVCTQLNGFKYNKWLNSSILLIDWNLACITITGESWLGRNSKWYSPNSPKIWDWRFRWFSIICRTLGVGILPLGRDAVGVLYSPSSRLGSLNYEKNKTRQSVCACFGSVATILSVDCLRSSIWSCSEDTYQMTFRTWPLFKETWNRPKTSHLYIFIQSLSYE